MALDRRAAIKKLRSLVFTPKSTVDKFRTKIEEQFYTPFLPNRVELTTDTYNGVPCDILTPDRKSTRRNSSHIQKTRTPSSA